MKMNFDKTIDRRASDSIKWNFFDQDVLPLWVADMDFEVPKSINSALMDRIDHGVYGYSKTQDETRIAIKEWLSSRHGWHVSEEDILVSPGVVQSFNITAKAFTNPGDAIMIQTPAYHPFFDVSKNAQLELQENPLTRTKKGRYFIDPERFLADLSPNTRVFILCNPHNPTGRVFSRDELSSIAQICLEKNIIICSDEIHSDLIFESHRHIPIASLSEEVADQTVTLISASKTFNIAGLNSSAAIITNPLLREKFTTASSGFLGSVNILGETAMSAAYTSCEDWLNQLLFYLDQNRELLVSYINQELPGVEIYPPEGTYLGWLDCSGTNLENPGEFFLDRARVGLNSGDWFGEEYIKFVRLNFACPRNILLDALSRMKAGLDSR
jgi:cystathionine beta-lyase